MKCVRWMLVGLAAVIAAGCPGMLRGGLDPLRWERLPVLPDALGFGGPFVGVSNDALLVAGGANFPVSLFDGGKKVWHDDVFVLTHPQSSWRKAGKMPRPLAYGGSVSTPKGVLLLGGCDAQRCYDDVVRLTWKNNQLHWATLPKLPRPCALCAAARMGRTVYVAGGQDTLTPEAALKNFWALDLSTIIPRWRELEPWPGPARNKAVLGVLGDALYLFGGTEIVKGSDGKTGYRFLADAYRYRPGAGWEKLPEMPRPAAAAPSLAPQYDRRYLMILGGADGTNAARALELKHRHPGFARDVLGFDTVLSRWVYMGEMPISRVTTTPALWQGMIVVPTGEVRPGVRSPEVWAARPVSF